MNSSDSDLHAKELDIFINRFGSFCGILLNKNISCVTFFSQLLEDEDLRKGMEKISGYTWFDLVKHMTYRYPILHKSKKIKKIIS